jgi:predicted nucleotidyltransferase
VAIVTLRERKERELARRREAVQRIKERLRAHVQSAGNGRFIIFGSAASDTMRFDSDIDILIDFPPERESAAWRAAEEACREARLPAHILSTATTKQEFLDRVMARKVDIIA